jgi:hypothetical protein
MEKNHDWIEDARGGRLAIGNIGHVRTGAE